MDFINHTPFPALAFEGIDQHNQQFHVVVLRQTLTWNQHGKLIYADQQQPLCEADQFLGATNQSVVRQESDLCHYKPRCDVIVNAVAHAPRGRPALRFAVRLVLKRQRLDAFAQMAAGKLYCACAIAGGYPGCIYCFNRRGF